jgi:hypothetical protein
MKVEEAVKTLTTALREDPGFFHVYWANIAMAFEEEYREFRKFSHFPLTEEDVLTMGCRAAHRFMTQWCKE